MIRRLAAAVLGGPALEQVEEAEARDSCGAHDGGVHMHTGRCWRAGFRAGWLAAQEQGDRS